MQVLDLFFPPVCVSCHRIGTYLCETCQKEIVPFSLSICPLCDRPSEHFQTHDVCKTSTGLDGLHVAVLYNQPIQNVLSEIKYQRKKNVFRAIDKILELHAKRIAWQPDILVPIPLHPKKRRARGFNQAELLAQKYSHLMQVDTCFHTLIKTRHTSPQAEKSKENRREQDQFFHCISNERILGKRIAIVDDVATTRTTLLNASEALKKGGAIETRGLVLAHPY